MAGRRHGLPLACAVPLGRPRIASVGRGWRGMSASELVAAAAAVRARAYAPYSSFAVGAAIRGAAGGIFAGCNVENAAYPQGQCAEATAIGVMVAAGERAITEVAVVGGGDGLCTPCGGLPAAPGRVRPAPNAGASGRARGAARDHVTWASCCPWRSVRSTSAAPRQRPHGDAAAVVREPAGLAAAAGRDRVWARAWAASRSGSRAGRRVLRRTAGLSASRACRATPAAWCSAAWAACRSPALQGRAHLYEGVGPRPLNTLVRTIKAHRLPGLRADQRLGLAAARTRARARWC